VCQVVQYWNSVDTSAFLVAVLADSAPEDFGGCAPLGTIALVGPLEVAELDEGRERRLELMASTERTTPKHDPPVFVKDRSLEPLHEAVRPSVSWLRPSVLYVELSTCPIEIGFELTASVCQHPPQLPVSPFHLGNNDILEERSCLFRVAGRYDLGHRVRAGRITRSQLPQLTDPFEVADVERVDAYELAGLLCLDMAGLPPRQVLPCSLRQESGVLRTMNLENQQPLSTCSQPQSVKCSPDRGR